VQAVHIGEILRVMRLNVESAQKAVANLGLALSGRRRSCACGHSLKDAIITDRSVIPPPVIAKLRPIIGKYV
jgi:hypothetical protein